QSFSIGAGNIVRFIQPDSSSLALNRVIGPDPSMIFGSIQANGRVVIMNPAGIYFGPSAMVDVNGLVATTSRMNQADFLAGNLNFSIAGDVNARVINEGFVNVAQGGFAVLSAAAVENKGTIVAQGGTVVLAGTPTFTLDFFGDGLLKFASTGTVTQAPAGATALVDNSGTVQANGGRVLMTARAARDVINNVINVTGIVEARSARIENGEIVIDGGENGTTVVAGRLDVSGNEADAKGGNVTVLGGRVELAAGTDIRASGEAGGGTVLAGGGQHGQGTAYNAQTLYMDAAAVIAASATLNGDGGKVVLWADDTARVEGFADTVSVDTRAINGRDGTLLIDPTDFTIATIGGDMTALAFLGILGSSNVTIDSTSGSSGTAGNINIDGAIAYVGGAARTITFNALGGIYFNAGVTSISGALSIALQAAGNVVVGAGISTNGGSLTAAGYNGTGSLGGSFTNTAAINVGAGNVTLNTIGGIALAQSVTSSGTVTLNAGAAISQTYGILGTPSLVVGGTGAVTLNELTNTFANITLNRAGTTTNVSIVTSVSPNLQASTLGTGSFYLGGVGFTQSGAVVQDALADSFTIQGNTGTVTLSHNNFFTGDVTVLGGTINVMADQVFDIASSANLNLLSNGSIYVENSLTAIGAGSMNMIFNTRYAGAAYGSIYIQPASSDIDITTNGGYIVMGGGTGGLTNALPGVAQAAIGGGGTAQGIVIQGYNDGGTARSVSIATNGGNFFARGTGATSGAAPAGFYMYSTAGGGAVSIATGAGSINIYGQGGTGNDGSGVFLQGNSGVNTATLQTTTGNITVTGVSGSGASSHGILAAYFSEIETGSGTLTLNGSSVGSGFSRGLWSLGVIDAGSGAGSSIIGTSVVEYGILAMPGADWRVANSTLTAGGTSAGAGAAGVGMDGIAFSAGNGTIDISGEGGSGGNGISLSGAITLAGDAVNLVFNGTGAAGDIVVSGTITTTSATGARAVSLISTGDIDIQGTPAAVTIGATTGGMLNFSADAAGDLTLGGKIVTEGGGVGLNAGRSASIYAGIETFGGYISIYGNATGGSIAGANFAGAGNGVTIHQQTMDQVIIDAGGGNIDIAGVAGDTGGYNIGVLMNGGQVQTTGTGAISIKGKGGAANTDFQVGVYINGSTFFGGGAFASGAGVSAGTGGLIINGDGGTTAGGNSNYGVVLATSYVTSAGFVNIEATGGAGASDSILLAAGTVQSTGAGYDDILLTGHAPVGTGYGINFAGGFSGDGSTVTVGGASFQGSLFLRADSLSSTVGTLNLSHQPTGGTIQFETLTPSLGIGVNGGDASGGMAVTAGILGSITGFEALKFGNSSMTGAIQMDSTDFSAFAGLSSINDYIVQTQGVFYSNTLDFAAKSVTINAGGASGGALTNIDQLTLTGAGSFTGNVEATYLAIDKTGTSGSVDLTVAGSVTLDPSTMGSGTLTLNALSISQAGALVQDANGGNVTMTATGSITLNLANNFTGTAITIEGASVTIGANQSFTRGGTQTVNLTATAGNVLVSGELTKSGTGGATFNIDAAETAWFANAGIYSDGGNINVWGNAPGGDNNVGTTAGTAWGVRIDGANAILSAGAGNIEIVGKGATDSGAGQHGIVILNGGRVETDSGYIMLSGRGGDGTGASAQGIIVLPGASIASQSGYIELFGYGGANSSGAHGIAFDVGASISTATGAYILFAGQGYNGGTGVIANGSNAIDAGTGQIGITSNNGIAFDGVALSGTGGASFDGGTGNIALNNGSNNIAGTVGFTTSAGNASFVNANTGTLTLGTSNVAGYLAVATGGAIDQGASPIHVTGATNITAGDAILLTNPDNTFGGAVTLTNSGASNNVAIFATNGLTVDTVTTQGSFTALTGGGILTLAAANSFAAGQNVTLTATGGGAIEINAAQTLNGGTFTADGDAGVNVTADISTSGGNINLYGNAPGGGAFGAVTGAFHGVAIEGSTTIVDAGGGNIAIKGAGGDTGTYHGVTVRLGAGVQTSGAGTITIEGQGGSGATGSTGVEFYDGGAYAQTQNGALTITGTGGSAGYGNFGVALATAELRAIGAGAISVTGTGGGLGSVGVHVGGGGATSITAIDGNITINATGGGANDSGAISWGLEVGAGGQMGSITTSGVGNIAITATAGGISGDNDRHGMIVGSGGSVITQFANISIDATGGAGSGTNNHGLYLDGGSISAFGTSAGISILADSLAAEIGSTVSALGTVTLAPQTSGADIGIGGGSGVVQLPSDLSIINAGTLKIGDSSTGLISVGAGGIAPTGIGALYLHGTTIFLDGDITLPIGNLTLHGYSGGVVQNTGSSIDVNNLVLRGAGNFTLDGGGSGYNAVNYVAADVTGNLTLRTQSVSTYTDAAIIADASGTVNGISATGDLTWTSQSSIGQATGANVVVGGSVNLESIGGGVTLFEAGNVFTGSVGAGAYGGVISLRAGSITVGTGGIYAAGNMILATTSGGLQQSTGALTAGGDFNASSADGIMLSNSSNTVTGYTLLTTTSGNIDWTQASPMNIGSINSAGTLDVSVTGGSISQVGAVSVVGTSSFTATGGIALTNASNAFGGALSLTATSGSASVTNSGALTLGDVTVGGALTVTAGGALTQLGASFFSAGSTSLSATGTMTLTESGNNFGTSLLLNGAGGSLDGTVNSLSGAAAVPGVTATSSGFTFAGETIANSGGGGGGGGGNEGTTTNTVTTETLAQIITQILTSTVVQQSSSTASTDATTVNPVSPAAVQAMLIAILAEAASPAGGTGGGETQGDGTNTQQAGAPTGTGGQPGAPTVTADAGTFGAGTTITINTSGGAVQSITVTPVGGGAPVTILPGLLNLTPPAIPTATATGTPGISGNFPLAWGGR
ncbi:MAG: filamentous hemagglutinin N-terminal domain-containing protein, partial [Alphaproteobacteria bacterium]|nr:filamentous hemagglutinin N-terminal domain-containing protein [Alphaproteobacteria bacterium]